MCHVKNKKTVIPYEQRAEIVHNVQGVDHVIPEYSWEQKQTDIRNYNVDLFVMGDDWRGRFDFLAPFCQVEYLERTPKISTTLLKSHVRANQKVCPYPVARQVEDIMELPA